jgi:hypothetical protein
MTFITKMYLLLYAVLYLPQLHSTSKMKKSVTV